jgi:hypothetical protein
MMKRPTYENQRAVALELGDWLTISCALYDAADHNEAKRYPATAARIRALREKIFSRGLAADMVAAAAACEASVRRQHDRTRERAASNLPG